MNWDFDIDKNLQNARFSWDLYNSKLKDEKKLKLGDYLLILRAF